MANLIDIVKELIPKMQIGLSCDYVYLPDADDFTYRCTPKENLNTNSCTTSTYWVFDCMDIDFNGLAGVVVNVSRNNYFDVKIRTELNETEGTVIFQLLPPKFVHGTVPMSNVEIKDDSCIPPICYLWEIFTSQYQNQFSSIEFIGQRVRLFFLNNYSQDDHLTDDHYTRCIYPMEQMALYFVEVLRQSNKIESEYSKSEKFDLINRVKIGSYKGINGNDKGLFNKNLSGVELVLNIPVVKENSCSC